MSSYLIQLKDMPSALGVSKSSFDRLFRHEFAPIQKGRCVFFSRIEIEQWIANNKQRYECPNRSIQGDTIWEKQKPSVGFVEGTAFGTLTSKSSEGAFARLLEQRKKEKLKRI